MSRLLCWLGFHKWSHSYFLYDPDVPRRECYRCLRHEACWRDGWGKV